MRTGAILSLLFHLAIVLLLIFGLPDLFEREETIVEPVSVQLATIADLTTAPKPVETPPKPVIKPADTPPPPAPKAPTPPTPPSPPEPKQAEQPPPKPEEAPPPPPSPPTPPQPQPAQTLPDLPQPEVIPDKTQEKPPPQEAKIETPPAPELRPPQVDKPKPKPERKPVQQAAAFNSLLKNLTQAQNQTAEATPTPPETPPEPTQAPSAPIGEQLTSSELDAVKSQVAGCWYLDPGKKGADTMVVEIHVTLGPDGGVIGNPEIMDTGRAASDPTYRAAAEAARRALLKCSPLRLPTNKYDLWRSTTFRFDAAGMIG
jgi:hypothetical protein